MGKSFRSFLWLLLTSLSFRPILSNSSPSSLLREQPPRSLQSPQIPPNDSLYATETYLTNTEGALFAELAWTITTGSPVAPVAILSNGCRVGFQPLPFNEIPYPRFQSFSLYDTSSNLLSSDIGTIYASILSATTNNSVLTPSGDIFPGIAGVCWNCQVICLNIFEPNAAVPTAIGVYYGIVWATKNNVKIVLLPDGIASTAFADIDILYAAMQLAKESGVLVISSPGTTTSPVCDIDLVTNACSVQTFPALMSSDNLLISGQVVSGTIGTFGLTSVDIFCQMDVPIGVDSEGITLIAEGPAGGYGATMVAAVAAVMWGLRPCLSYTDIKSIILTKACSRSTYYQTLCACGGTMNMCSALLYVRDNVKCNNSPRPRTDPDPQTWKTNLSTQLQQLAAYTAAAAAPLFQRLPNIPFL